MRSLPPEVKPYCRTPEFNEATIPSGLLRQHTTKPGVWGRIVIEQGCLTYRIADSGEEILLSPERHGVVEPQIPHEVAPEGKVRFWVEFLK